MEPQEASILLAAEIKGYKMGADFVLLEQWTGAELERPKLGRLRAVVQAGLVNAVFVLSSDRLSRDLLHLLILFDEFQKAGAKLEFVHVIADATTEGQLMLHFQGYAARLEREQIVERTMRAKEKIAKSGRLPNGTSPGLFGYDYDLVERVRNINEQE